MWLKLPEENRPAAARPSVRLGDLHRPVGFASRRCRRFALIGGGKNHPSHCAVSGSTAHCEEYGKRKIREKKNMGKEEYGKMRLPRLGG